jgi:hypothetical protein
VGKLFKEPKFPIFVVCSESHYTVLFSVEKHINSEKIELFFYDSLANQTEEIRLSLEAGMNKVESRDQIPPIELCLFTKWGEKLKVDWNGTEPHL